MNFADACDRIMYHCQQQSWIRQAPNDPAAVAAAFPFAAVFPSTGQSRRESDMRRDLHTVNLEIHWAFRDLPRDAGDAKDHLDSILNDLWDDITLNSTVDCITAITYDFGPMAWGAAETLGYIMHITFKQRTAIT